MTLEIADLVMFHHGDGTNKTVSFTVKGQVFAQERPRIHHADIPRPQMYDPSSQNKAKWAMALLQE